jgi:hypothetical protein
MHNGSLTDKRIVDTLVVNRRRFRSAVSSVVAQDEFASDGRDLAGIFDPTTHACLKPPDIRSAGKFDNLVWRSVPENQNAGTPVDRTQNGPVDFRSLNKRTFNYVPRLSLFWNLGDAASSSIQFFKNARG